MSKDPTNKEPISKEPVETPEEDQEELSPYEEIERSRQNPVHSENSVSLYL